jgi:hypothetical protein
MFFIRLVIFLSLVSILFQMDAFAASGTIVSTGSKLRMNIQESDTETGIILEEKKAEDKKTEKNAQKIILDVYKIQGNKILKDMDTNIEKLNSDPKVRIDVYSGIQKTLELRKQKLEKSEMSDESKDILTSYIDYMISSIEKRKKNLE